MPDTEIDIPGVGRVAFPDSMTKPQIDAAATRLYQNARVTAGATSQDGGASDQSEVIAPPGDAEALGMATAAKVAPRAVDMVAPVAQRFAASRMVPKVAAAAGSALGNMAGGGVPVVSGITSKIGEFAGGLVAKGAQKAAGVGAAAMNATKPYAQTLATLSGAQGALDLAQMADPDRRDIGVLGVGPSVKSGAIPDTPKLVSMAVEDAVKSLTDAGWPEARAKSYVTQMRKLMSR